jgi:nucleotide-binding universal stress UspA family protein
MFTKILVCLDGSRLAEQIVPHVIEIATNFRSKLILLRVVPCPQSSSTPKTEPVFVTELKDGSQREIQAEEARAKLYLERMAQPLRGKDLDVECVVLQGAPGASIVSYANENKVGLITIPSHVYSNPERLVFDSIEDFVLWESGLPILLIKPEMPMLSRTLQVKDNTDDVKRN